MKVRAQVVLYRDPDTEWLDHDRPVGLVVAPGVFKELGLTPLHPYADLSIISKSFS